jgi:hypothetical protein
MWIRTFAATLTLIAQPALPFDQDEFCQAATEVARRANASAGRWLDRSTRHDGVRVDCESKTVEFRRFLNADPDSMRSDWEERKARDWNSNYCVDQDWREAIDNGWKITSTVTIRTGDRLSFVAEFE